MSQAEQIDLFHEEAATVRFARGPRRRRLEQQLHAVLHSGAVLTSPGAQERPVEQWESHFRQYSRRLQELSRTRAGLSPDVERDGSALLSGDALRDELLDLFA